MLGSSSPAVSISTSTSTIGTSQSETPASPSRPSRLRGLSYLRTYTQNHLLSHNSNTSQTAASPSSTSTISSRRGAPPLTRSLTSPARSETETQPQAQQDDSPSTTITALPPIGGQGGISRLAAQAQQIPTNNASALEVPQNANMTRNRAATVGDAGAATPSSARDQDSDSNATETPATVAAASNTATAGLDKKEQMPSIRFIPHNEPRTSRPSLTFPIITRTLATPEIKVKVGRYSERDSNALEALNNPLSTAPVGFKSKVVSRRHCEFWCQSGQWYIKDVRSSSGTFLNHVRLSSPGQESRPYPVNDGDIVQLGIDFKGGEEIIFRCVKIRIECNRGWQKSLNQFNTSTHKRLLNRAKSASGSKDSDAQSTHSSECSICLNPVAPCQALFVAPCSHVWHYKCIRTLIYTKFPSFQCPNCRAYWDLDADVDQPEDDEEDLEAEAEEAELRAMIAQSEARGETIQRMTDATATADNSTVEEEDMTAMMNSTSIHSASPAQRSSGEHEPATTSTATSQPVAIIGHTDAPVNSTLPDSIMARSATPTSNAQFALTASLLADGPMTPMNDAGPFVFDGLAGRSRGRDVDDIAREPVQEENEEGV